MVYEVVALRPEIPMGTRLDPILSDIGQVIEDLCIVKVVRKVLELVVADVLLSPRPTEPTLAGLLGYVDDQIGESRAPQEVGVLLGQTQNFTEDLVVLLLFRHVVHRKVQSKRWASSE
jgi:hypothetical protein